jgi:hypothetical protein
MPMSRRGWRCGVFVADRNERRNITKGQKAMARAILFPEDGGKGGRGKKGEHSVRSETGQSLVGFGREFIRQARAVYEYSPKLADEVRDGFPLAQPNRFPSARVVVRRS